MTAAAKTAPAARRTVGAELPGDQYLSSKSCLIFHSFGERSTM